MYQEILQGLDLSPNEAKMYEVLVERGESSVGEIAVAAKIHRRNAYDAMSRLINKGLCFEILSSAENRYNAVDPDKLLEIAAEKQQKLQEILPELRRKFVSRLAPEEAYIFRGFEGQKNVWRNILRVGKDVFGVGAKAQWFDPHLDTSRIAFFKEANRKKINFHMLFDYEIKTQLPDFPKTFPAPVEYRFLPKAYSTNSIVNIFGDYVVTYTGVRIGKMDEDTVLFVIHSQDLAESYRTWFGYMWEHSSGQKK